MSRLEIISQINPLWAVHISEFLDAYPEFKPYSYCAPFNEIESIPYKNVATLFQSIIHYICSAGVQYSYAIKQWDILFSLINNKTWHEIKINLTNLGYDTRIQPKKRFIYFNLCQEMDKINIDHNNIALSHLSILKNNVNGMGDGCLAWCKKYFSLDEDCVEYTDIMFKKGFKKLYQTDNITQRKNKAREWINNKYGRIANLMVIQIGGYVNLN